ncbi:hypothetical protein FWF89_03045 [Candidatus Saccharibacteria bacterium]|nr:hypothetical protein [Candidatus Saccharibacteria bacterium]
MEKKLKTYHDFLKKASAHPTPELIKYHKQMLAAFQHERLIHLIVTMFFALFMIIFFIFTTTLFLALSPSLWSNIFCYSAAFITLILFVVTLFYIRHYYQLENGVQKLEELTTKLYSF